MRLFLMFVLSMFLMTSGSVYANCNNPQADAGTILFNNIHDVFQGCTKSGKWMAFHGNPNANPPTYADCSLDGQTVAHGASRLFYNTQTHANCATVSLTRNCNDGVLDGDESYLHAHCNPPVPSACETGGPGTDCGDGSFYIGSLEGGPRIYAAPSDETGTKVWGGYGSTVITSPSLTDGYYNTYPFLNNSSYPAGYACASKAPAGTWYLPSKDELNLIWTNRESIQLSAKGFNITSSAYYWSSSEYNTLNAWFQRFSDGLQDVDTKVNTYKVRCVRR